jgi:NAD(P)-dependent dehydrogenase (short-subunit alcohol dehydrogenase family)
MDVNVKGVFLTCKIFGSLMSKNNRGSIINISSIYGVVSPDQSLYEYRRKRGEVFFKPIAYAASKSALLNLTRYLAVYWAKTNVRVNTLVISGVYNGQEEEFVDAYTNRIPIGRMANYDEYNGAVIFLASEASKYMTGSNLTIDGGWTSI